MKTPPPLITHRLVAGAIGRSNHLSPRMVFDKLAADDLHDDRTEHRFREAVVGPLLSWYAWEVSVDQQVRGPPAPMSLGGPDAAGLDPKMGYVVQSGPAGLRYEGARVVCGLEVESLAPFATGWGDPGTDEVPDELVIAATVGMACWGLKRWEFIACLDAQLCVWFVERKAMREKQVLGALDAFMHDFVLKKVEPPLNHADSDSIKARFPTQHKAPLTWAAWSASRARKKLIVEFRKAHLAELTAKKTKEAFVNRMKEAIGEHAGLLLPDGERVDFKSNSDSVDVAWESIARDLAMALQMSMGTEAPVRFDELVRQYSKTNPGARPLTPRFKKK